MTEDMPVQISFQKTIHKVAEKWKKFFELWKPFYIYYKH